MARSRGDCVNGIIVQKPHEHKNPVHATRNTKSRPCLNIYKGIVELNCQLQFRST